MKIENIAPYIPFGLKVQCKKHFVTYGKTPILEVNGISKTDDNNWQYEFILPDSDLRTALITDTNFKPLLKDMSDLTREELEEAGFDHHIDFLTYELQNNFNNKNYWRAKQAPYEHIEYLISQHYDVFNLLYYGQAIKL